MGQCLSSAAHDAPDHFKGRWQQGGLADGLAAFGAGDKYGALGEQAKPAYTTTADVGLGPKARDEKFGFMQEKAPPPTPLQLERIDEDATLHQGGPECSPLKAAPATTRGADAAHGAPPAASLKPINWMRGELVGQGAFGSVFVAMDNDTGELIAVKEVHIPRGGAQAKKVEENIRSVEEEVQLLQQFDHPNIVRYLGTEKSEECLHIFLEYVPGGSIASLLARFGCFRESVIRVYTKQIMAGLEYLHSKGVMHRDIKGANILVDHTGLVKLADFGASKKLEDLVTVADGNKSVRGTPYWMAPEVITQTGHGRQADLWSVACTVLEMATGRPPWSTQYTSQVAAMFHIASSKGLPDIPQHLSPECKDFLYLCFNRDWKARPPAATLLLHPFLADVPLRAQPAGPSPSAAALSQACRVPRMPSVAVAAPEPGDAQFGTPSPLNPRLAAAQAGMAPGAARISLQGAEGGPVEGPAPSPLGRQAPGRQQLWDTGAAATPRPRQQQQQQVLGQTPRESAGGPAPGGRLTASPVKRPAMSLRASAPAFSGYASVALSRQGSDVLGPPPAGPAAPTAAQQQQLELRTGGDPRGSSDSGSVPSRCSAEAAAEASCGSVFQGSPANGALPAAMPAAAEPARMSGAGRAPAAAAARQTPAAARRQAPAATPGSAGASSGNSKSDYNPMEEPSWMQGLESPLAADGTPTSGLSQRSADTDAPAPPQPGGACGREADSGAAREGGVAPPSPLASQGSGSRDADQQAGEAAAAPEVAYGAPLAEPAAREHLVWTNDDGDIDALPWDMGGWSTGSSGQREGGAEPRGGGGGGGGEPAAPKPSRDPVGEDALIGALQRKAQHDVRASLALFEKSLSIPALHMPPSPAAAASPSHDPVQRPAAQTATPTAESIESRGGGAPAAWLEKHPHREASAEDGHWRAVQLQPQPQAPSAARPHVTPLAAAVGGLSGLGYGGGRGAGAGGDRESVWQQELSQELFRVQAGSSRRLSTHGSPAKRPSGHA